MLFRSACARISTDLEPHALLALLKRIEVSHGRRPGLRWGPRTLDLDILDYDGRVLVTPDLVLPHPFVAERAFVLVPLAEIAPDHRVAGRSICELLTRLDTSGITRV